MDSDEIGIRRLSYEMDEILRSIAHMSRYSAVVLLKDDTQTLTLFQEELDKALDCILAAKKVLQEGIA